MLNSFEFEKNCRILIGLCKYVFMSYPIMFLDRDNKAKLVRASFSYFLEPYERKINFVLKSVIVITVIIFLDYKETN